MAFRHPLRNEFDRLFADLDPRRSGRDTDGAVSRANLKLLFPFVEQIENERNADTPAQHFLHAMVSVLSNQLAGTIKYTVEKGEQVAAVDQILKLMREQVIGRFEGQKSRVFFPGFSP